MNVLSFTWLVKKENDGLILRDYLSEKKRVSRRLLTDLKFHGGQLLVNEEPVTVRATLQTGDKVTVVFPKEIKSDTMKAVPLPLSICYEDEHILVVHKRAGLATIPSRREPNYSLAQGILHYYELNKIASTIHIVTRLDRDTSGLVLVAKHRYAHSLLSQQQINKEIEREYVAVVEGLIKVPRGTISLPIARKSESIIERTVDYKGKEAITHYEVLDRVNNNTIVKVRLETGRTHQIRVHFSAIGFPLVGDELYGGKTELMNRQALHCYTLCFIHPFTQERLFLEADLSSDIHSLIKGTKLFT